jgi:hypothetical protein
VVERFWQNPTFMRFGDRDDRGWFILAQLFATLISWVRLGRLSDSEKELEILILRHQWNILERKQKQSLRPGRAEKLFLAILTTRLKQASERSAGQIHDTIRIFQPETVLRYWPANSSPWRPSDCGCFLSSYSLNWVRDWSI